MSLITHNWLLGAHGTLAPFVFFKVKVKNVRTSTKPGKSVSSKGGRPTGRTKKQKKAFITLKEGKIELI